MKAQYLIRLDDACPTMNRENWGRIEELLDAYGVAPIVAVVPNNKDPELVMDDTDPCFWDKVRSWQAKGWWVAMHGYTHVMHRTDKQQILPFYKRSEFSGLTYEEQSEKIKQSYEIFNREKIRLNAWIAPAHCFDYVTLDAIKDHTNIKVISDGMAIDVYHEYGFYWIPQQLWNFRKLPFGLFSLCLHPNKMRKTDIDNFQEQLDQYSKYLVSFSNITMKKRKRGVLDRALNAYYWIRRGQLVAGVR